VVENDRLREILFRKDTRFPCVISGNRPSLRGSDENRRNGMMARIPPWIGIGMHLPFQFDIQTCFFKGLADRRLFQGFSVIDKSPGDSPADGVVLPFDQDNPPALDFNDDINGRERIFVPVQVFPTAWAFLFHFDFHPVFPRI